MSRNKILPCLGALPVLLAFVMFLAAPAKYAQSVREGVSLWAVSVLPAAFPFLFLTAMLSRTKLFGGATRALSPFAGKTFRVSGAGGCIFLLSVLSGYPVGAKTVLDCRERGLLGEGEVFRLACLCSTTGPTFLVGVVGAAMLNRPALGWLLFLAHLLGVAAVCFLLRFPAKKKPLRRSPFSVENNGAFYDGLYSSVISVLCVGGAIALFACFGEMVSDLLRLPAGGAAEAIVRGLVEMTTGCKLLCAEITPARLALCCFFVTFGGACVLCQQFAYLLRAGVKPLPFIAVKLAQGALSALLCYLFSLLLL